MDKLKSLLFNDKIPKKVAIVGSSNNLQDYGKLIDEHDIVIRFNLAHPTRDKFAQLGSKMDILACNCHVTNAVMRANLNSYINKNFINKDYADKFLKYISEKDPLFICRGGLDTLKEKKSVVDIPRQGVEFCNNFLRKRSKKYPKLAKFKFIKPPRLGFHLVCLLIKLRIKPTLFYFDIKKPSHSKFYNIKKLKTKKLCHDIQIECDILKQFLKLGLIKTPKL